MFDFIRKYISNDSGVAAVEFSFIAPILIMVFVLTIDTGMYISSRMQVLNTATVVAEYIAQYDDDSNAQTIANESYSGDDADLTVASAYTCECDDAISLACPVVCADGDHQRRFVDVTVDASFTPLFPYPGFSTGVSLTGTARARVD